MPRRSAAGQVVHRLSGILVSGKRGGLTFCFDSAVKCWLDEDGILRFVIAWGHNGNRFNNRQGPFNKIFGPLDWFKPMDLRIRGKHRIRVPQLRPTATQSRMRYCLRWPKSG